MLSELQKNRHIEHSALQEFIKQLADIYKDGIVTPAEIKMIQSRLQTMSKRP